MADSTPDEPCSGTTIGNVAGNIDHALIAGRDIIGNLLITGDHNQVFAGGYERLADAYIKPQEVFDRVYLEHFTGREWLLAAVDAFLQEHDCGYFILEADAGLGKTTFLAWLVKQRNYVHHFSELAPGPEGIEPALKSLAAQLALAYELKPEGVLPAAASRPDYLYDLLCQAAQQRRPGEKIVLVVDALDQAGTRLHQNVLGLPSSLPDGVYVIVSQRPIPVPLQIKASHTARTPCLLTAESGDNQSDMRRFLARAAVWPGIAQVIHANGSTPDQFVATLLEKSRGLWIYLHYVVAQLEQGAKGKGTRHLDLRLDRLPDGLTQYYIRYWQAWRDADEDKWYNLYLPLLTTLAAAQEAVTLDRLLAWAGVTAAPPGLARLFSERWRPFLIMVGHGQLARYRFYHATLPEFFAGQSDQAALTTAEQSLVVELAEATCSAHDRLAERYLQVWGGLDGGLPGLRDAKKRDLDDRYGVRYLPVHLSAAGRSDDLHRLLRVEWAQGSAGLYFVEGQTAVDQPLPTGSQSQNVGYQNAWYTVLEALGQTDRYLSTVTTAWRLAEAQAAEQTRSAVPNRRAETSTQANAIALQCRYALVIASLNSLANNVMPGFLKELLHKGVWLPQQALAYARQVPDFEQRTVALAFVALHLSADEQVQVMQEALRTAQFIEHRFFRVQALTYVASHMAGLGQVQEALRTAQGIEGSHLRDNALAGVATRMAELGQLQEALRIAQGIEHNSCRAQALAAVGQRLSGDENEQVLWEALTSIQCIEDSYPRANALAELAPHLTDEHLQEALRIAQGIDASSSRAQALAGLASRMARLGQIQEALRTARSLEDSDYRAKALAELAPHLTAEYLQEALGIAQGIDASSSRARASAGLASRMAGLGQIQEALRTARSLEDSDYRVQVLAELAPYLSESQLHETLRTARGIKNSFFRTQVLVRLAPHLTASEEEQLLQEALPTVPSIWWNSSSQAKVLADLALRMAELGRLQEALDTTQKVQESVYRAQVLAELASRIAELGQLQKALRVVQGIEEIHFRAQALAGLAPHLSAEQLQEALQIAQGIEDTDYCVHALAGLASCMAALGQLQEALRTVQGIKNSASRARALAGLSPNLSPGEKRQVLEEALRTAQAIDDSFSRDQSLAELVFLMADLGQLQEALRTAQGIEDSAFRAGALTGLAPHLSDEQLWEALRTAKSIKKISSRAQALAGLASHLSSEQLREALRTAKDIKKNSSRAQILAELTRRMAELGQVQEALRTVQGIEDNTARARALTGLATHLSGDQLQEALCTARGIADGCSRARALAGLSPQFSTDEKEQILADALRATQDIEDDSSRAPVLAELASRMGDLGQLQGVLRTAQSIEDRESRSEALAELASRMAEIGQLQEALQIAESIEDSGYRDHILAKLASRLAELGQLQEALRTAQSIEDDSFGPQVLAELASRMAELRHLQKALHIAQNIEDNDYRAQALASVAPHLSIGEQEHVLQEALRSALSIEDRFLHARVLGMLVPQLIERSPGDLYTAWCEMLPALANRTRSHLLDDLTALAPVISQLGGRSAIAATAKSIQDVGRWWP